MPDNKQTNQPDYWRQLDICGPAHMRNLHVTVIGCGGIGSPTALALAKMGVPALTLFDADKVETHNLPNQMFKLSQVGLHKTQALKDNILEYVDCSIQAVPENYNGQQLTPGIVISGVDSMVARKDILQKLRFNPVACLYIEARMGGEVCRIYTLNPCLPSQLRWYEGNMLYTDEEAAPEPCTEKAIIYNTFFIAALIANQVKKFVRGEQLTEELTADMVSLQIMQGGS